MTASSFVLQLTGVGQPRRYQVRTTTAVQVGQTKMENELLSVVECTLLGKNERGYVLQMEVLHAVQKNVDLFTQVAADVNLATRTLVLQTDPYGRLLRVENQPAVLRAWEGMRKTIQAKYATQPTVRPFLDAFEQQLATPGSLEPGLRDKGVHGALLVGVYGQPYHPQAPALTKRTIAGFFHDIDLPLVVGTTARAGERTALLDTVQVTATATLDGDVFAATDFRRLMRSLVDDYKFPVDLELDHAADHLLDSQTGALLRSQQRIRAEVPGIYHNAVTYDVFPQPAL